ncbi:hypothetical protein [Ferrovibrio sp.]|uniref:hypothetical protein n=1 Tax=Ferrovibrio sp. TaxID=1917215 RepID=UPI002631C271|nr:hypothetical protein [Ferrovibrio sp.]
MDDRLALVGIELAVMLLHPGMAHAVGSVATGEHGIQQGDGGFGHLAAGARAQAWLLAWLLARLLARPAIRWLDRLALRPLFECLAGLAAAPAVGPVALVRARAPGQLILPVVPLMARRAIRATLLMLLGEFRLRMLAVTLGAVGLPGFRSPMTG